MMINQGMGISVGETVTIGHNCSILHHINLGGLGKKGFVKHSKIGKVGLLVTGSCLLGNINIKDGYQVGAGTLVISDLPP